ncbi:hypothetical protein AQUCO_02700098v1 [Aquilegia coerulea]|uniref:WPP domain-containing protein n=1 Tax=Aquilegia coerulea TaxID=218851 RepID=A0A2G5D544_AQUCA|nr:hypothetical protein AQUCO_02700098v1 [Aquilegia coerulea]
MVTTINQRSFSIKFWPLSQCTRLMLVERMTKNLSMLSIFSKKYGILSTAEAQENAKQIEDTAFAAANEHYEREPDGDGSSAVQLYAKESSKHMLEVFKRGPQTMEKVDSSCHKEAEEILRPLSEKGNSYSKICFSNRSFGRCVARVAEPILVSLKDQLTESSALEGCVLKFLDLSNNALGEKEDFECSSTRAGSEGGIALTEALNTCISLKKLDIRDNMFGVEAGLVEAYLGYLNLEDEGAIVI